MIEITHNRLITKVVGKKPIINGGDLFANEQIGINKWDKSVPVEENTYYWKGEPVIYDGHFEPNGRPVVAELFCGCGGTSLGFEMAGFQIAFGSDILIPAINTFKRNHHGVSAILGDIHKVRPQKVKELLHGTRIDVLIGGVPCQGFSLNNRKRHEEDKRNKLYLEFIRFVKALKPRAVVLENPSTAGRCRNRAGPSARHRPPPMPSCCPPCSRDGRGWPTRAGSRSPAMRSPGPPASSRSPRDTSG